MRDRILKIIKLTKTTQKEFAESIGITQSAISQFLKGQSKGLHSDTLIAIINKYNINPTWLLTGEGDIFLPGKEPGDSSDLLNTKKNLDIIEGTVSEHPEIDILPKIAHTGWWKSLTETEREIIVFMAHLKDATTKKQVRDLLEACLKKEITQEELLKKIEGIDNSEFKQKGAAG
ncbi:MAG: helix-turn-helix transcriptional regulator [Spirochaetota bacterium]